MWLVLYFSKDLLTIRDIQNNTFSFKHIFNPHKEGIRKRCVMWFNWSSVKWCADFCDVLSKQSCRGGTLQKWYKSKSTRYVVRASSFISDTHQRIMGLLAKRLGMGPRGWLLPRRWSGVMFSPADPHDRCAGRPQQHTLAGFPGLHPAAQHASLFFIEDHKSFFSLLLCSSSRFLHHFILPHSCTLLSHPARWAGTEIASGTYLYV